MKEKVTGFIIASFMIGAFLLFTNNDKGGNTNDHTVDADQDIQVEEINHEGNTNGIKIEYLREFFEMNGFTFEGPVEQVSTYYYSAKLELANGDGEVFAQI